MRSSLLENLQGPTLACPTLYFVIIEESRVEPARNEFFVLLGQGNVFELPDESGSFLTETLHSVVQLGLPGGIRRIQGVRFYALAPRHRGVNYTLTSGVFDGRD